MEKDTLGKRIIRTKAFPLLIVLIIILTIFTSIKPSYLTSIDNIRGILNAMSLTGTIAVGVACLLISGGMDLSVGAAGMFGGVMVSLFMQWEFSWGISLLFAVIIGAVIGGFNAFLVNGLNFMGFIATIGTSSILQGLANVITGAKNVAVNNDSFFKLGSTSLYRLFSIPFLIMLVLMIIYGLILAKTRFGRKIYMCGGNRVAAQMCGLKPKKIKTILHINASAVSALGGAVLAARMRSGSPSAVIGQEFNAITASILGGVSFIGGTGSMAGCFIGLLLLTCFTNGLTFVGLGAYWTDVAQGVLLITALVVDYINTRSLNKRLHVN